MKIKQKNSIKTLIDYENDKKRQDLWISSYLEYVRDGQGYNSITNADKAVEAFDKKFFILNK